MPGPTHKLKINNVKVSALYIDKLGSELGRHRTMPKGFYLISHRRDCQICISFYSRNLLLYGICFSFLLFAGMNEEKSEDFGVAQVVLVYFVMKLLIRFSTH